MKYVKLGVTLLVVALIIISCEIPGEPQAPTLIEPEDGTVFETEPPTFIWSSDDLADNYVIRIYMGSSTDIQDTLADTTYAMSNSLFETMLNGTYNWLAAAMSEEGELFWSESRSFVIQKPGELTAPNLILPEDGAVFETTPPTFIWSSDSLAAGCVIRIFTGSSTALQDTLQDTTYTMSDVMFDALINGNYSWAAANLSHSGKLLWSESRTLLIDRPIDLDTTYFPFGLGYEWCYERHDFGWDYMMEMREWDYYDTFSICVLDSFWEADTLVFDGVSFRCTGNRIWDNSIEVKAFLFGGYVYDTISIINPEPLEGFGLSIRYKGDTLVIIGEDEIFISNPTPVANRIGNPNVQNVPGEYREESETRVKGIGTIAQYSHYDGFGFAVSESVRDRLLYFYNGEDTVYEAD